MFWALGFGLLLLFCALGSTRKPGIAIGLLINMYGIESFLQCQSDFFVTNGRYVNLGIVGVVLIAVVFTFLRDTKSIFQVGRIQVLALFLYAYGYISFNWSMAPDQMYRWRGALPFIVIYLVLAPMLTRQKDAIKDGLRWSLIIGVPMLLLIAFYCEWGNRGLVLAKPIINGDLIVTETPPLAVATLASSLAIIALVSHLRLPFPILFRFGVVALGLFIAFLTESRGQVVAIIGVSAIVYPISNRVTNLKGLFLTLVGICAFGLIVYYLINNMELMRWRQDRVESAVQGRQEIWIDLFWYWAEKPGLTYIIGLGAMSSFDIVGFYPHNLIVEVFCELGFIGIGIYGYILLKSAHHCLILLTRLEEFPELRGDVVALIGLIGVNFALSLKEGSLYGWPPLFFYMICLEQQIPVTYSAVVRHNWLRNVFLISREEEMLRRNQFPHQVPAGHRPIHQR